MLANRLWLLIVVTQGAGVAYILKRSAFPSMTRRCQGAGVAYILKWGAFPNTTRR